MSNVESNNNQIAIKPERYSILKVFYQALRELGFSEPLRTKERLKEVNQELRYLIIIHGYEPNEARVKNFQRKHFRIIRVNPSCEDSFKIAAMKLANIYRNYYKHRRYNHTEADIYSKIIHSLIRNNKSLSFEGEESNL